LLQDRFVQDFFDIPDARIRQEIKSAGSGVIVDPEHGYSHQ
jgi:hypothetical protein